MSSSKECSDSEYSDDGGPVSIYPHGGCSLSYPPEDLVDFSTKAITKYNHKKGCAYVFVELVEGLLSNFFKCDNVETIFKARQSDDHDTIITFKASAYSTSRTLSDPNLHIRVAPFLPDSPWLLVYSSDSDSESESESSESPINKQQLGKQVKQLQIID